MCSFNISVVLQKHTLPTFIVLWVKPLSSWSRKPSRTSDFIFVLFSCCFSSLFTPLHYDSDLVCLCVCNNAFLCIRHSTRCSSILWKWNAFKTTKKRPGGPGVMWGKPLLEAFFLICGGGALNTYAYGRFSYMRTVCSAVITLWLPGMDYISKSVSAFFFFFSQRVNVIFL